MNRTIIGLKVGNIFRERVFVVSLNRTIIGLKERSCAFTTTELFSLNRTIIGLFFVDATSEDTVNDDALDVSFKIFPMCNNKDNISLIPLQKNEAYKISFEDKRGLEIQFLKLKRPK